MGRRLANVSVTVWQTTRSRPVCTARAHFLLD
ncbi:MAG: PaaI family thioesterase, partial [Ketobacteraceae bacterium]|nr:PaaI family thioesterase [Ketobacteraceae bacterium]